MAHKPKLGRKASDELRAEARKLHDLYAPAFRGGGGYCVNPEDDAEIQQYISVEQAGRSLLEALQLLAETGWLVDTRVSLDSFLMNYEYRKLKEKHGTTKGALAELAKKYPRSERTLQRIVRNDKR